MATLNAQEIFPILHTAWACKSSIELLSGPGLGKTSVVKQFCQKMADRLGEPFGLAVRHPSTEDPSDVAGPLLVGETVWQGKPVKTAIRSYPSVFPQPAKEKLFGNESAADMVFFPGGEVPDSWVWGSLPEHGVVLLDEFRQAHHDVQRPLARLIEDRAIGDYALDELGHWSVFMASNRSTDRSGAQRELAFISNRKGEVVVNFSATALVQWLDAKSMHHYAKAYVEAFPGEIALDEVPKEEGPFRSPRALVRVFKMLTFLGNGEPATTPAALEIANAFIGMTAATHLMGFLRRVEELPTWEEIKSAPTTARISEKPDVAYATMHMLVEIVKDDPGSFSVVMEYLQRMGKDFQASALRLMLKHKSSLARNKSFIKWISENHELVQAASGR